MGRQRMLIVRHKKNLFLIQSHASCNFLNWIIPDFIYGANKTFINPNLYIGFHANFFGQRTPSRGAIENFTCPKGIFGGRKQVANLQAI